MSCEHGNHVEACDLCDAVDAAFNKGYLAGQAAAEQRVKVLTEKLEFCRGARDELERERDELERERDEYGNALHDLWNAADDSDGSAYGTLSTKFVRDICKVALEVKKYV